MSDVNEEIQKMKEQLRRLEEQAKEKNSQEGEVINEPDNTEEPDSIEEEIYAPESFKPYAKVKVGDEINGKIVIGYELGDDGKPTGEGVFLVDKEECRRLGILRRKT